MRRSALRVVPILLVGLVVGIPGAIAQPPAPEEEAPAAEAPPAPPEAPSPRFEPAMLIAELRTQQLRLGTRERELAARERAVGELEAQALRVLEEAEAIRALLERRAEEWERRAENRLTRLAKVYGAMPPVRSAPILEALDLELATEILTRMKHKESAKVMALMSDDSALRISRKVARPLAPAAGGGS